MHDGIEGLKRRLYDFGVSVVRLCDSLPRTPSVARIAGQLTDSATAVSANYRAACRAQSRAAFISKMGYVEEEADESEMWLTMLLDLGAAPREVIDPLRHEAHQITGIAVASIRTARANARATRR